MADCKQGLNPNEIENEYVIICCNIILDLYLIHLLVDDIRD